MSAIPPDMAAGILNTAHIQQQANDLQRAESDANFNNFRAQFRAAERADGTVAAGGEDTRIDPDTGGTGGQGRAFNEAPAENPAEHESGPDNGISVDESGQVHLDLEA